MADGTFDICAVTNEDVEDAPWPFVNKDGETDFAPGQFFEGGINLSECSAASRRASAASSPRRAPRAETDAQLKDFALGDFNTCVPPDIETDVLGRHG